MARALLQKKLPAMSGKGHRFAAILAAAACALVALGITLHMAKRNQAKPPGAVASAVSSPQGVTPALEGTEKAPVILLVAERLRGAEPITRYQVHPGSPVELQVLLTGKAPDTQYKLQIVSSGPKRRILVEREGLRVHQKEGHPYLEVTLPAGSLPAATYDVIVSEKDNQLFASFEVR